MANGYYMSSASVGIYATRFADCLNFFLDANNPTGLTPVQCAVTSRIRERKGDIEALKWLLEDYALGGELSADGMRICHEDGDPYYSSWEVFFAHAAQFCYDGLFAGSTDDVYWGFEVENGLLFHVEGSLRWERTAHPDARVYVASIEWLENNRGTTRDAIVVMSARKTPLSNLIGSVDIVSSDPDLLIITTQDTTSAKKSGHALREAVLDDIVRLADAETAKGLGAGKGSPPKKKKPRRTS